MGDNRHCATRSAWAESDFGGFLNPGDKPLILARPDAAFDYQQF